MSNTLETLRAEIATLVSAYAKEQYKTKPFIPGETVVPPSDLYHFYAIEKTASSSYGEAKFIYWTETIIYGGCGF